MRHWIPRRLVVLSILVTIVGTATTATAEPNVVPNPTAELPTEPDPAIF